jgi:rhodanese-related sulfurtransferase
MNLTTSQLLRLREYDKGLFLVSVQRESQFRESRIPGSRHAAPEERDFAGSVRRIAGGRQSRVVLYDEGHDVEGVLWAARTLKRDGFLRVFTYFGGMKRWRERNLPVERGIKQVGRRLRCGTRQEETIAGHQRRPPEGVRS